MHVEGYFFRDMKWTWRQVTKVNQNGDLIYSTSKEKPGLSTKKKTAFLYASEAIGILWHEEFRNMYISTKEKCIHLFFSLLVFLLISSFGIFVSLFLSRLFFYFVSMRDDNPFLFLSSPSVYYYPKGNYITIQSKKCGYTSWRLVAPDGRQMQFGARRKEKRVEWGPQQHDQTVRIHMLVVCSEVIWAVFLVLPLLVFHLPISMG